MFSNDMTVSQFIYSLENYNTKILQHISENRDYSYLIDDFKKYNFFKSPKYREAFFVYQLNQEEYYLNGLNITNEMKVIQEEPYFHNAPETAGFYIQAHDWKALRYACSLTNFKKEFYAYTEWIGSIDDFLNIITPEAREQRETLIKDYRNLCSNLYVSLNIQDLKKLSKSDLQFKRHEKIINAIETRDSFAPRYLVDISPDHGLNQDVNLIIQKLESLESFTDRLDFIKQTTLYTNDKNLFKNYHIRIENIGIGGRFGPFIKATLNKNDDFKKKYFSGKLAISEKSKEFIILLFFYLSLPIDEFETFLEYEGYSIHKTLPLLYTSDNTPLFIDDLMDLCESGLSYNTILAVLFGKSTYQSKFK